jgi:hypothetical protein
MENVPRAGTHKRMVEGGADVDENKRTREDGATHHGRSGPASAHDDEVSCTHYRKRSPNAMRDCIRQDVA